MENSIGVNERRTFTKFIFVVVVVVRLNEGILFCIFFNVRTIRVHLRRQNIK